MSSTNKTANYNLSQFIGTDKPTWLNDYNGDMSKIDSAIAALADGLITKFDLSTVNNLTVTASVGTISSHSMKIAKNGDGSIAKVYGNIAWDNASNYAGDVTITLSNTGLGAITSEFDVQCAGIRTIYAPGINSTGSCTLKYKTNGTIEYKFSVSSIVTSTTNIFIPFITFIEDFGD